MAVVAARVEEAVGSYCHLFAGSAVVVAHEARSARLAHVVRVVRQKSWELVARTRT